MADINPAISPSVQSLQQFVSWLPATHPLGQVPLKFYGRKLYLLTNFPNEFLCFLQCFALFFAVFCLCFLSVCNLRFPLMIKRWNLNLNLNISAFFFLCSRPSFAKEDSYFGGKWKLILIILALFPHFKQNSLQPAAKTVAVTFFFLHPSVSFFPFRHPEERFPPSELHCCYRCRATNCRQSSGA